MSAIGGGFARHGGTVSDSAMHAMAMALPLQGSERATRIDRGQIGMLYRGSVVEPPKPAPLLFREDGYCIAFHGRVDNSRDVWRGLGSRAEDGGSLPELVLRCYCHGGIRGLGTLIGDFAFALWDPANRQMVLGTDPMGRKPLYYSSCRGTLFWCSHARPLLAATGQQPRFNEEYFADFLANRVPASGPFTRVEVVPGGHVLVADETTSRCMRYWAFDPSHEIRYAADSEYEEHFRDLFRQAVACRLEGTGTVFCELSGGVDSSSIACVADHLLRTAAFSTTALQPVSYVFEHSPTADETAYIAAVEQAIGRDSLRFSEDAFPLLAPLPPSLVCDLPTNGLAVISRFDHLARVMNSRGSRVLLSGLGGDQLFWSEYPFGLPLADLLRQGRLRSLVQQGIATSQVRNHSLIDALWRGACVPNLPRQLQKRFTVGTPVGEWLAPAFTRRTDMRSRMLPMPDDAGFKLPVSKLQYGLIRRTMRPYALEPCLSQGDIDIRYPYLDRRLVEFALAIPLDQKIRPTESRSIVRRSLTTLVPGEVLRRQSKAGPEEAFYRALIREWPRLAKALSEPRLADLGIVDRGRFVRALQRARHGLVSNQAQLSWTLSLELWIRHVEHDPGPTKRSGNFIDGQRTADGARPEHVTRGAPAT